MAETSDELILAIIEARTRELQTHALGAFHALLLKPPRKGEPAIREGEPLTKRQAFLWWLHRLFHETVIPEAVRFDPSMTPKALSDFIKQAWPGSRGPGSVVTFDERLVLAAHEALLKENPTWGGSCATACDELAKALNTTSRTIQKYLARARKNS